MKPVVVILGAVALLAVGGGGAMLLMSGQHAAPPAEPAAPPISTEVPPAPAALPTTVNFVPLVQNFSLLRDSAAYVAADQNAPQFYPLKAGTPMVSAARSPDGAWTVAMTQDGRAAFIPSGDIGPYDPRLSPLPQLAQTVSGAAEVIDTGTLMVDGQTISLAGVIGRKGDLADKMQGMIAAQGPQVNCTLQPGTLPQGGAYICTLPAGTDIGRSALFNGVADVADGASDDYRAQADAGRAAHRGMWQ